MIIRKSVQFMVLSVAFFSLGTSVYAWPAATSIASKIQPMSSMSLESLKD